LVHARLVEEMRDIHFSHTDEEIAQRLRSLVDEVVQEQMLTVTSKDRAWVADTLVHDVLGLGPLEDLLKDPSIAEIMVNGPDHIYVERAGKIERCPVVFKDAEQLRQVIDRIVGQVGRRVDESSPMVDARLKDGSRVNVIIPPVALKGATLTIRKFAKEAIGIDDLIRFGTVTPEMAAFLQAAVKGRLNIVVSGGTGSGKTTTLNVLSSFIPDDERIVTIEDAAELQLPQDHVVTLETRPANVEGRGKISIRELVINALRMRPDRIIVGECRGGEALDMLQAMNTGHDGSLTTLHANNPWDAVSRLETMVLMAGVDLPMRAIREQISSAVDLVVHQSRLRDGTRRVVSITEVGGVDHETGSITQNELFSFSQTGVDPDNGRVLGQTSATGVIPDNLEKLHAEGQDVPLSLFEVKGSRVVPPPLPPPPPPPLRVV
jgi:pilus assembly protein CpaF